MKEKLFRKKSMDKVSSPDQLNDYIKVASPSVWLALSAVIILLIGAFVWGVFGHLDTKLSVACQVKAGQMICYVKDSDLDNVKAGMKLICQEQESEIDAIDTQPIEVTDNIDSYLAHIGGFQNGDWIYQATVNAEGMDDGVYKGQIIIERVSPISFVLN